MAQITIQKSKISVTKSTSKITERKQLEQTIEWLESAQQLKEKQTKKRQVRQSDTAKQ